MNLHNICELYLTVSLNVTIPLLIFVMNNKNDYHNFSAALGILEVDDYKDTAGSRYL